MAAVVPRGWGSAGDEVLISSQASLTDKATVSSWKNQCFNINDFTGVVRNKGFQEFPLFSVVNESDEEP